MTSTARSGSRIIDMSAKSDALRDYRANLERFILQWNVPHLFEFDANPLLLHISHFSRSV